MSIPQAHYQEALDAIQTQSSLTPEIGLVLGSGLGGLANEISDAITIPYETLPHWPRSTVHGHHGNLIIGMLEGKRVIAQQGRAHFYEGYSMREVTFPIRIMHLLGVQTVILTNAAGGVDRHFKPGDVMLINDHINFPGLVGHNPLMGANEDTIGPRFVGLAQAYDRQLRAKARDVAERHQIPCHEGVYAAVSGPTFETPAEIRMLRTLGAQAVGMSTVHEVVVARHAGLRVLACSGITNTAIDTVDSDLETNHEEVLAIGQVIVPRLTRIVRGVLAELPQ